MSMTDDHEAGEKTRPTQLLVSKDSLDSFPWDLGVYDAHCHPTDTLSSLDQLGRMKARVLTVMATRADDQHLVDNSARSQGLPSVSAVDDVKQACCILPSFGWHPWFSHQLYDDAGNTSGQSLIGAMKVEHYMQVVVPSPDEAFIASLPNPRPLSRYLAETKARLEKHP